VVHALLIGLLWEWNDGTGYVYVFLIGVLVSLVCLLLANRIRVPAATQ